MNRWIRLLCHLLLLVGVPAVVLLPGVRLSASHPPLQARSATEGIWSYTVRDRDVLTVVAQRELGTFRRYKEILALNPELEPRALQVGSVLTMPPREPRRTVSPAPAAASPGPRGLLPLLLGMLGLMVLVLAVTVYLERRADARRGW